MEPARRGARGDRLSTGNGPPGPTATHRPAQQCTCDHAAARPRRCCGSPRNSDAICPQKRALRVTDMQHPHHTHRRRPGPKWTHLAARAASCGIGFHSVRPVRHPGRRRTPAGGRGGREWGKARRVGERALRPAGNLGSYLLLHWARPADTHVHRCLQ